MATAVTTRTLRQTIASHPIVAFLLILYPVSWIFFLPPLLGKSGLGVLDVDIPPQVGILLVTIFGLTGVAYLVTSIADGKDGTRALRRHYFHFRAGLHWYFLAFFAAPILLLLVSVVTHGTDALKPLRHHGSEIVSVYLLNLIVIAVLISLWEEGGWMAFVTARLQQRWGPVLASLAVAPLFGFIHFPMLVMAGGLSDGRLQGIHILEYAFYLIVFFSVPVRIVVTWLYNATGGSLPVVALLHASIDTTAATAVLTAFYPGVDGRLLYAALAVVALALVVFTRGRLGYREVPQNAAQPSPALMPA